MMAVLRQRKSPRLQGYDYSQSGVYFVTICTYARQHLFGEVCDGEMILNSSGEIASEELQNIPLRWTEVDIDLFVAMPNHIHIIIILSPDEIVGTAFLPSADNQNGQTGDAQKGVPTLGQIIGNYKAGVTRRLRQIADLSDIRVWQERYHDHIIRSENTLHRIQEYVLHNPKFWTEDIFF